jgi:hypothetical protein
MAKSPQLVFEAKKSFENKCIILLEESYYSLKEKQLVKTDYLENDITALINKEIDRSQKRKEFHIVTKLEYYIFNDSIIIEKGFANKQARIDMQFHQWWGNEELLYHVEAKRLDGRNTLMQRYISTGILNYLSGGKYHKLNGFLMGYLVLNPLNIELPLLNKVITTELGRSQNISPLGKTASGTHEVYQSIHPDRRIKHLFFEFLLYERF